MHISFNFDTSKEADLKMLTMLMARLDLSASETTTDDPAPEPRSEAEPVAVKRRARVRPEMRETEPQAEPEPQSKPDPEPAPSIEARSKPEQLPLIEYTIDDVRGALQMYTAEKGVAAGIAVLKSFGAGRISELKAEDYPAFMRECTILPASMDAE